MGMMGSSMATLIKFPIVIIGYRRGEIVDWEVTQHEARAKEMVKLYRKGGYTDVRVYHLIRKEC